MIVCISISQSHLKESIFLFIPWWVAVARDMATQQAHDIVYPYNGLASI